MAKKTVASEEMKTFDDLTFKSWVIDGNELKVGESGSKMFHGELETLEIKDIFYGEPSRTWTIAITTDDKIHLLKSAREVK
ncbi:hypothetical protein AGMMS50230_08870 [Spirochaetia bacterium]|nr:hypothetical protein AGMMS50230_08870 [Spirochaetia bacterium]